MTLPLISIVVPNYNGGATIAKTLQSLVDQNYPKLEILVADGLSKDNSVEIIRQFEPHLAWWVSETDSGQTNAINKGFARAKGEVLNWLCSDDILLPGALQKVGEAFASYPDVDVVVGKGRHVFPHQVYVAEPSPETIALMPSYNSIAQPACFYRRRLLNRPGPCDETFNFGMDFELWNYFVAQKARWHFLSDELSEAIETDNNKTNVGGIKIARELERIYRQYVHERIPMYWWYRTLKSPLTKLRRHPSKSIRVMAKLGLIPIDQVMSLVYGGPKWRAMDWHRYYNRS